MNSFLENRPVVSSQQTETAPPGSGFRPFIPEPAVEAQDGIPAAETASDPRVEVVTHEGRVQRIIVTCTCCKRIELDCMY